MSTRWPMPVLLLITALAMPLASHAQPAAPADQPAAQAPTPAPPTAEAGDVAIDAPEAQPKADKPELFRDPDQPLDKRVADLIDRLTLAEKISQLQETSPAIERFDIEGFQWWSEGIHGVGRAGRATVFPAAIALAATWNERVMQDVADATATEFRAKYNNGERGRYRGLTIWAPSINLIRDPRWGRIHENYSEDPYLTARLGVAFCRGLQGDDPTYLKTAATPKHFAVHSSETERAKTSFDVSMRQMREYYFPAFRACYQEAGAVSCMMAFTGVNGVPCTENRWLMQDILRDQWGFDGAIVTDWGTVGHLVRGFENHETFEQAAAASIKAGIDVVAQPRGSAEGIQGAYDQGLLTETDIDRALTRAMKIRFRLGMFDPPDRVPYTKIPPSKVGCPEHHQLALQSSRESIVLLKNQPAKLNPSRPMLPIDRRRVESIAVFGPDVAKQTYGDYSGYPANPPVTVLDGIVSRIGGRIIMRTANWKNVDEAVEKAAISDLVILSLGLNMRIEHEGHDRKDMDLPLDQREFVKRIVAVNPNVIVVLVCGSPVTIHWIQENVPAVLMLWYPGEQGGNALADVLLGQYNPAGRLPMTFYRSLDQLPDILDYDITNGRTYMYLRSEPLYPFGYGLSYTTFDYSNLTLDQSQVPADGTINASVTVTNTGQWAGDEVVQLYISQLDSKRVVPIRELRGFKRLAFDAGQSRTVAFAVDIADLADWDEQAQAWFVEPGTYEIQVGASSSDIRVRQQFEVRSQQATPDTAAPALP